MKQCKALTRLWLNSEGRHVEAGEVVELPDTTADVLVAVGAVAVVGEGEIEMQIEIEPEAPEIEPEAEMVEEGENG